MKKARIIAVIAALIVSLSGCANTDHPQTIQDSSGIEAVTSEVYERTEPEDRSSASVSESKESTAESTATVKAETESAQAENSQPAAEQNPAPGTQPPQTVIPNNTPKPETPKAVEPTPEPKPTPTQPTPPPAEETPKVEQPQETTPPNDPAVPEFDIQTWIDYAKAYAVNIGLRLENSAVDCWDNPITAGAFSSCLERDIQSRLDRYSRDEDITDVWIWAQARSDGSYDLYIGYA
ncbi:hypothetical protein LIP62_05685 [Longicatena caecimuris]|uniref:hypothetical protein n=1 Tax=Longicatena caecimuris TaxID=1796635 RepID=UPI001D032E25|nr:hypothetical protein [Longicatena caecimuris]MCB5393695.1 hypothetical protein [Longicatena caecimuris]MCB5564650.1 hypothetical protein [Longicatena caecimuris]